MRPRRTTGGAFVSQRDETLSRPHETLDFIVAGSILAVEYFQLLNGDCFVACLVKEAMHGKQGSKVWGSFRLWDTCSMLSMCTIFSYLGVHPASVVRICGRSSMAGNIR